MEPEGSLPCSQEHATDTYLEPDKSSPHLPTLFPYKLIVAYKLAVIQFSDPFMCIISISTDSMLALSNIISELCNITMFIINK
jgi:hypothetical protein